jgi:hypothetical protein
MMQRSRRYSRTRVEPDDELALASEASSGQGALEQSDWLRRYKPSPFFTGLGPTSTGGTADLCFSGNPILALGIQLQR